MTTQSTHSYMHDSHEVEPRVAFENLPQDVQRRLFQLMAALTGADQLHVPEAQPAQVQSMAHVRTKEQLSKVAVDAEIAKYEEQFSQQVGMSEEAQMLVSARDTANREATPRAIAELEQNKVLADV